MIHRPEIDTEHACVDTRIDVDQQYLGVAANVRIRNALYDRYVADGRIIHQEVLPYVGKRIGEVVLDAGCADGQLISEAAQSAADGVRFIGMDLDSQLLSSKLGASQDHPGIDLLQGNVNAIGLADQSVDTALAMFVLYHSGSPKQAISELRRVLRPEGKLIVATSGKQNKARHRAFERAIAADLGVEPPPIFAEPFNVEKAMGLLGQKFSIQEVHAQETHLVIADEDAISTYICSIDTMKDSFSEGIPSDHWVDAVGRLVRPTIEREIEEQGAFKDRVVRYFYVCKPLDIKLA